MFGDGLLLNPHRFAIICASCVLASLIQVSIFTPTAEGLNAVIRDPVGRCNPCVIDPNPDNTLPTAVASPVGSTYNSAQSVTLTASEPATIYYTTDGSTPTTSSAVYSSPLSIGTTTTLEFFAKDTAGNIGTISTESYIIDTVAPSVTASPVGSTYNSAQSVTLTASEPATIYYTTDGSTPTTSSAVYSSPLSITSTTTLKFFGKDAASNNSNAITQTYTIFLPPPNKQPFASASSFPLNVQPGSLVTLDGSTSYDPDNSGSLSYLWTQLTGPQVVLSSSTSAKSTFTAPNVNSSTDLVFQLVVNDGQANSVSPASTKVTVLPLPKPSNIPPVAVAASALSSTTSGSSVTLDGTGSYDPDGDKNALSYKWIQTAGPKVSLSSFLAAKPTFTAPTVAANTIFEFRLTVNDGKADSNLSDPVSITVLPKEGASSVASTGGSSSSIGSSANRGIAADTAAPVIQGIPQNPIIVQASSDSGVRVEYPPISVSDDQPEKITPICSPGDSSILPIGDTTVNCNAKDNAGHTATASFVVSVRPPLKPDIGMDASLLAAIIGGVAAAAGVAAFVLMKRGKKPPTPPISSQDAEGTRYREGGDDDDNTMVWK